MSFYRDEEKAESRPQNWKKPSGKGAPGSSDDGVDVSEGTVNWPNTSARPPAVYNSQRDNKHPAEEQDFGTVEDSGGSAKVIPWNKDYANKEDMGFRFAGLRVEDLTKRHPELVTEAQETLRRVPPHLLKGVREIFLFPPERSSMYLSTPGHGGEHSRGTVFIPADKDWTGFISWEEILLHEVGHSVHDFILSGEQQAFLIQNVGWGEEWKEDFASAFGAYFFGDKTRAKRQHPHSYRVVQSLLGRDKIAIRMHQINQYVSDPVRERASEYQPKLAKVDKKNMIWTYTVGKWEVKAKVDFAHPRMTSFQKADLHLTCSCPFWRWQGPEHWGQQEEYLRGKPRGTASFPIIRDPDHEKAVCKHVYAVFKKLEKINLPRRKEGTLEILRKAVQKGRVSVSYEGRERIARSIVRIYLRGESDAYL